MNKAIALHSEKAILVNRQLAKNTVIIPHSWVAFLNSSYRIGDRTGKAEDIKAIDLFVAKNSQKIRSISARNRREKNRAKD
jgi:hypothetical protein